MAPDPNSGDSPRRRGPESTLEATRAAIVAHAVEVLERSGVEISISHIKLADVIDETGIARSTAYRSLADDNLAPQDVLHREVFAQILGRETRNENLAAVSEDVMAELERQASNLDSEDPDVQLHAKRSLIRVGCAASYAGVVASTERSILTASYGALQSSGVNDWRSDELVRGEQVLARLFADVYTSLAAIIGDRLRPGLLIEQFSTAIAGLLEGLAMRHGFSDYLVGIQRPTGPTGELEEWTLFGIAFEGVYFAFFEPAPET